MASRVKVVAITAAVALAAFAGFTAWCWKIQDTPASRRSARAETMKKLRSTAREKPAEVLPYLEKLSTERSFHAWFDGDFPWMHCGFLTRVPLDYIGQLTEDAFLKFSGNGEPGSENVDGLKAMLGFSEKLLESLSPEARSSMMDRRLDGYFLIKDYDGAIALLEKGVITSHSPGWCKGTAAKLRYHKAVEAGDKKEAVKQLKAFTDFMMSDEQKDFEECDPTTGILYSREWVVARNFMRCADLTRELGDAAASAKYVEEAKKLFKTALEKAKEDDKSLEELKKEVKPLGL